LYGNQNIKTMKAFALRIKNDNVFDSIAKLSQEEDRSLNNLINVLIVEALEARKLKN